MKSFLPSINPTCKCFSVIILAVLLSFTFSISINVIVFGISIFLTIFCSDAKLKTVLFILIPVFISAYGLFMTGLLFSSGETTVYTSGVAENMDLTSAYNGLQLATRIFAFAGLGMLFTLSTNPIMFVYSLQQQLKLSPKFTFGILASFHLVPNIKSEFENSRFALNARGIPCHVFSFKPVFSMFVNAIRFAECLSMAMESKGFSSEGPRTAYKVMKISFVDILFLVLPSTAIIIHLFLK